MSSDNNNEPMTATEQSIRILEDLGFKRASITDRPDFQAKLRARVIRGLEVHSVPGVTVDDAYEAALDTARAIERSTRCR